MATTSATTHLDLELDIVCNSSIGEKNEVLELGVEIDRVEGSDVAVDVQSEEMNCRICHLSLDSVDQLDSDVAIVLGCSCKDDLGVAHKMCAETWFKIKGNKTCEICGALARNVTGPNDLESLEHWDESNGSSPPRQPAPQTTETQHFWKGHRFLNFLLACMVFAFVISWLFHFNIHLRET